MELCFCCAVSVQHLNLGTNINVLRGREVLEQVLVGKVCERSRAEGVNAQLQFLSSGGLWGNIQLDWNVYEYDSDQGLAQLSLTPPAESLWSLLLWCYFSTAPY